MRPKLIWLLVLVLCACRLHAQEEDTLVAETTEMPEPAIPKTASDSLTLRRHLAVLSSKGYAGRGYVARGMQKAGAYISAWFLQSGLQPFDGRYEQTYTYKVNTFPSVVDIKTDGRTLAAGVDYLVDARSSGATGEDMKLRTVNGLELARKAKGNRAAAEKAWAKWRQKLSKRKYAYLLENTDTLIRVLGTDKRAWFGQLPPGIFLQRMHGKPVWTASQELIPATLIDLYDSTLVLNSDTRITATVQNRYLDKFKTANIAGYVPGTEHPDSFIVITAHYDHLGKMGNRAWFPGASDNASGSAMLLNLAAYYAAHPQPYSIAFIAFSGEEAGLLGSDYYIRHPLFPLAQIRFLVNLDIMGDASQGITVVNGSVHQPEFDLLSTLNRAGSFVPEVKIRGKAANSDHHRFSEAGVPAIFIYTNGGKGFYHDVWDKAEQVSLERIPALQTLLQQFIGSLQQ